MSVFPGIGPRPLVLMPDVEYVLWDLLRQNTDVTALIGGLSAPRIYKAALPKDPVGPLVKITRIAGTPLIPALGILDESRVQFDCYGGSQREANRLAETLRAVLTTYRAYVHTDGQIVSAFPDPPVYIPDVDWMTDRGGPKPRYIFDTVVTSKMAS